MYVSTGIVNRAELTKGIKDAINSLDRQEVERVAYNIGNDSTDDPSIFFRIVLTDEASRVERLGDVADRVTSTLSDAIRPVENWGLTPYFSFRSSSEQRGRNDPEWS